MSRLMDLSQNVVLYGDVLLPQEAFYTSDCSEMKLVAYIFETAKSIAELKLTETELALYQSLVLLWPGKCMRFRHTTLSSPSPPRRHRSRRWSIYRFFSTFCLWVIFFTFLRFAISLQREWQAFIESVLDWWRKPKYFYCILFN